MPKVNASLADVSTKMEPMEPGIFRFKIEEIQDKTSGRGTENEREAYQIISCNNEMGTDSYGKKVFHYISLTTKDGKPNGAGKADLKRYFEAVFGEEAVAEEGFDYDTDNLLNGEFGAEVVIESWEKGEKESPSYKSGKSNRFKRIFPIDQL